MSSAGSGETGTGAFSLCEPLQKTLPRLERTSGPLALATSFANAFVNFDFEPLLLVMMHHQLIGQLATGWSRHV
jgi:hypothetical protein